MKKVALIGIRSASLQITPTIEEARSVMIGKRAMKSLRGTEVAIIGRENPRQLDQM